MIGGSKSNGRRRDGRGKGREKKIREEDLKCTGKEFLLS